MRFAECPCPVRVFGTGRFLPPAYRTATGRFRRAEQSFRKLCVRRMASLRFASFTATAFDLP
jgi:hypothetical protein